MKKSKQKASRKSANDHKGRHQASLAAELALWAGVRLKACPVLVTAALKCHLAIGLRDLISQSESARETDSDVNRAATSRAESHVRDDSSIKTNLAAARVYYTWREHEIWAAETATRVRRQIWFVARSSCLAREEGPVLRPWQADCDGSWM